MEQTTKHLMLILDFEVVQDGLVAILCGQAGVGQIFSVYRQVLVPISHTKILFFADTGKFLSQNVIKDPRDGSDINQKFSSNASGTVNPMMWISSPAYFMTGLSPCVC